MTTDHLVLRPIAQRTVAAVAAVLVLACSSADKTPDTTAAATKPSAPASAPPAMDTTSKMAGMTGMANMTGDADHDFLRMMSDHHKGLIQLAHMTKEMQGVGAATVDAAKMDAAQDKELDQMMTMLEKDFKDPYAPKVMAEHQAMADELKGKTGKDYERTFYQDVIKHHQEALKMIDEYLPKAKSTTLKRMAEKMKTDQTKEIAEFQQKVAKLGA
jgi:uncharacterized protein (DUF305 family)